MGLLMAGLGCGGVVLVGAGDCGRWFAWCWAGVVEVNM